MIKLISINAEWGKHHETIFPFLEKERPDVLCLQEIFQDELPIYEKLTGMKGFFKPECFFPVSGENSTKKLFGPAILTKYDSNFDFKYIVGEENDIPNFAKPEDSYKERNITNIVLIWGDIKAEDGSIYRIATTHFTWTPEGATTEYQMEDIRKLKNTLEEKLQNFVLVGDLNAPRGQEAFDLLAKNFKDNIPLEYDSSLDDEIHRLKGSKRYVVDGLFSTPIYSLSNVRLESGMSDHRAVVAFIEKV